MSLSKDSRGTFNEFVCMCALLNLFKTVIGFIACVLDCPHSYVSLQHGLKQTFDIKCVAIA